MWDIFIKATRIGSSVTVALEAAVWDQTPVQRLPNYLYLNNLMNFSPLMLFLKNEPRIASTS